MKRNHKINMDAQIIKNSFVGVAIGIAILFALMVVGTICIQNEYVDISYVGVTAYVILLLSSFFSIILTISALNNESIYLVMVVSTAISLICCAIAIFLFDGLNVTVVAKALTVYVGGVLACFVKKALPRARKTGKRRARNR